MTMLSITTLIIQLYCTKSHYAWCRILLTVVVVNVMVSVVMLNGVVPCVVMVGVVASIAADKVIVAPATSQDRGWAPSLILGGKSFRQLAVLSHLKTSNLPNLVLKVT